VGNLGGGTAIPWAWYSSNRGRKTRLTKKTRDVEIKERVNQTHVLGLMVASSMWYDYLRRKDVLDEPRETESPAWADQRV